MLHEEPGTRRDLPLGTRRWYTSPSLDLIVCLDADEAIVAFQLCYDKSHDEHAITWRRDSGWVHEAIDDGELDPHRHKRTPVLVPDGVPDVSRIARLFAAESAEIPPAIAEFVTSTLRDLPGSSAGG